MRELGSGRLRAQVEGDVSDLLVQLMRSRGVAIYRSVLYERVWGGEPENDTRTLDLHIQRLRQKLGWADKIETVRGVGYKLKKEEV